MNATQAAEADTFEGEETLGAELRDGDALAGLDSASIPLPAAVNIAPDKMSVFEMKRKHDRTPARIRLDPDFQRHEVWTAKQKSELIESILMGIPLPLFYVKEDDKGAYVIVDGRQRLTALFQFLDNGFPLQNLSVLRDLNGSYFSAASKHGQHLSNFQQGMIEDFQINLHVIKPPTPDRISFDLFDRVNRGGTRLNNQEMRNALYQGEATTLLRALAASDAFIHATEHSIKPDRMKDRYLVLRLTAFYLWRKKALLSIKEKDHPLVEYRSDLEDFLGKTMLFLNSESSASFRDEFPPLFHAAMAACQNIFGDGCFRLPKNAGGNRRPVNMALFETAGYLMIQSMDAISTKRARIREEFDSLLSNEQFIDSTSHSPDSATSVNKRFELVDASIERIHNA